MPSIAVNAFMGFFTLMTYTAVEQGGLGFPVSIIGVMSACSTVLYLIFSPMIIPLLNRRLNARDSLSVVVAALPVESLIVPIAQAAATQGRMWTWSMLAVQLPLYNYHLIGWSLNDTWVAACFEYFPELLASGSAFVMIAGAVERGLGPVISG
ncbi:hypothetical protein I316_00358 [Kwoniella heveanensis BCC8398]|uniref:Uncharacterized protein n=1 Tax=Kwoniella heveanensis BCC8398 TaxID=1296120 RepID=A0A1B9H4D9_9TREE|nr:hypothetical protein I316_00358 [Kwoniella heveanensis BCC8398]